MNEKEQMKQLAQMKEQISREFLMITPEALDALRDMITDPNINPIARVQAIGLILERGLGKPETNIRIRNAEESGLGEGPAAIAAAGAGCRAAIDAGRYLEK